MQNGFRTYTAAEIKSFPSLGDGHTDDLKVDTGEFRVWLSRMGPEDGYRGPAVTYERRLKGRWVPCKSDGSVMEKYF